MESTTKTFKAGAAVLASGLALAGCAVSGLSLAPASHAAAPAAHGPPSEAVPSGDPDGEWRTVSYDELAFDIPADWEIAKQCTGECSAETTSYGVRDAEHRLVLQFTTTSATDADGDSNTYQREVFDSAATQLEHRPASMVSYYWGASGGARDLAVAVIDDREWQSRTEVPALDYFKTSSDAWPMMWMSHDYLQALGIDPDGQTSREEARAFLGTGEYATLKEVMTSVRSAA